MIAGISSIAWAIKI